MRKKLKSKKVLLILILPALVLLSACNKTNEKLGNAKLPNLQKECEQNNGEWLADHQECEYANPEWCENVGGEYHECESACRHSDAEICTMQCVMVCKFDNQVSSKDSSSENEKSNQRQKITNKSWKWIKTKMNNDEIITPKKQDTFVMTLSEDEKINGTTDCNNFFGSYEISDNKLSIGPLATTRKFCENSQEDDFLKSLKDVSGYSLDNGKLILEIKMDSGVMIFE